MAPQSLSKTLGTAVAISAARDLYKYGTQRMFGRRQRQRGYSYPSRVRYRRRYRYRRPYRRSRYGRKRVRLSRRGRVGMPIGYATTKRDLVINNAGQDISTRTLYSRDLTFIAKTTNNDINGRQRDILNIRGVKLNYSVRCGVPALRPIMLHMAIVAHTSNTSIPGATSIDPLATENFFRGNSTSRAINFQNALASIEFNNLNINQDIYSVLKRWKRVIHPYGYEGSERHYNTTNMQYGTGKKYIPIRRQVRYDDPTIADIATSGRLFLVYWCEQLSGIEGGEVPFANALELDLLAVTYFNEPLGC